MHEEPRSLRGRSLHQLLKTMKTHKLEFLILSSLTLSPLANAQAVAQVDGFVITASRTPQSLSSTLAAITIITRDEIDQAGAATLAELLQRKAGVEIRVTGGAGQPAGVFIRGAGSQHTLLLVDGLRLGSTTAGSPAFENIPLNMIERIEIVKGPLSGQYGSDAIGGVVQIFTRNLDRPRLEASAGFGSNAAAAVNVGFTAIENKTAITLNAGYRQLHARSATNADAPSFIFNPDRNPYKNSNVGINLSHTFWQGETISLNAWQSRGTTHFDNGPDENPINRQTLSGVGLSSVNQIMDNWTSRLNIGQTTDDSRITSSFPGTFKTEQNQAVWINEFKNARGSSSAGVEWREEKVASTTDYDKKKRKTASLFTSYLERFGQSGEQQINFSLRRDEEDQFGRRNTGNIAYGIQLMPALLVYVRGGRAFRAPSFNDLYYPGFSNPNLKPERSEQVEIGARWNSAAIRASLVRFDNRIEDLIAPDFISFTPVNIRKARIKGWELTGDTVLAGFGIKAAVTAQQPVDADTGRQLRSRAKLFGSVSVDHSIGQWQIGSDVVASGRRYDSSIESAGSRMGGYAVLNARVGYQVNKLWAVELSTQNITDRKYELARGYNPPARSVFLNVKLVAF